MLDTCRGGVTMNIADRGRLDLQQDQVVVSILQHRTCVAKSVANPSQCSDVTICLGVLQPARGALRVSAHCNLRLPVVC